MSKERLEEMEHDYQNAFPIDIDWLLNYAKEQAELVEELQKDKMFIFDKAQKDDDYFGVSANWMVERQREFDELEQQNKRYRAIIDDILKHAGTYGLRNLEKAELKKSIKWAEGEPND